MSIAELLAFARDSWRREEGQTMAEYGVVLAVICIATVAAFTALSGGVSSAVAKVTGFLG